MIKGNCHLCGQPINPVIDNFFEVDCIEIMNCDPFGKTEVKTEAHWHVDCVRGYRYH